MWRDKIEAMNPYPQCMTHLVKFVIVVRQAITHENYTNSLLETITHEHYTSSLLEMRKNI